MATLILSRAVSRWDTGLPRGHTNLTEAPTVEDIASVNAG
jgi:hypothetical protein